MRWLRFTELKLQSGMGKVGWLSSLKAGSVLVVALLSQAMLGTL